MVVPEFSGVHPSLSSRSCAAFLSVADGDSVFLHGTLRVSLLLSYFDTSLRDFFLQRFVASLPKLQPFQSPHATASIVMENLVNDSIRTDAPPLKLRVHFANCVPAEVSKTMNCPELCISIF